MLLLSKLLQRTLGLPRPLRLLLRKLRWLLPKLLFKML
jgi:hypothetical protein